MTLMTRMNEVIFKGLLFWIRCWFFWIDYLHTFSDHTRTDFRTYCNQFSSVYIPSPMNFWREMIRVGCSCNFLILCAHFLYLNLFKKRTKESALHNWFLKIMDNRKQNFWIDYMTLSIINTKKIMFLVGY